MWTTHVAEGVGRLQQAKVTSNRFDRAHGFKCTKRKCSVAGANTPRRAVVTEAFEYEATGELKLLGVVHVVGDPGAMRLASDAWDKMRARAAYVRMIPAHASLRKKLMRPLVAPCIMWAPYYAVANNATLLRDLRKLLLRGAFPKALRETTWLVLLEALGREFDPTCMATCAVFKQAVRWHCSEPRWLDTVPLEFATGGWWRQVPGAQQLMDKLGWWHSADGGFIFRRDQYGQVRRFELGVDGI